MLINLVIAQFTLFCEVLGGARCAEKLFDQMTLRVLQAPMSYFHTTPLGRILNRFTYDTEVLDIEVSFYDLQVLFRTDWGLTDVDFFS